MQSVTKPMTEDLSELPTQGAPVPKDTTPIFGFGPARNTAENTAVTKSEGESSPSPERLTIRIEKSCEDFTHLHTAIEFAASNARIRTEDLAGASLFQGNRPVILGVTSAIAGEGKTTVALHLAMDIARNNFKKVCLMDMSLGEDTLSRRLEINTGAGLVNVLEGTHSTIPTIESPDCEGLSIMPAGKTPDNPVRAARSPSVSEVLAASRELFDVVIVDMPSVASGNVLPIAPYLDAVVMVVYAGITPKDVVTNALERLDPEKVLGVVLNRVRTTVPSWLQRRLNRW
ncbi:MAG: CpsD/CapB family tyrosine-protein kinase [Cytophagales bacterium]|nr:CpsD/CapB family tyrosine-protein kinase [Armatimonadota bacterium]